jgi:hypothetical protein
VLKPRACDLEDLIRALKGRRARRDTALCLSLTCSNIVGGGCNDEVMTGDEQQEQPAARDAVADARREAARAQARLAEVAVGYADARIAEEAEVAAAPGLPGGIGARPGEFVADELSVMLRDQLYQVRCLLARSRRLAAGLPTVWEGFRRGDVDGEQIRVIDRVARRVTEAATLAAIDDQAVDAAQTRTPKQLFTWLLRLVVRLEPAAFAERHRRALADRRVSVVQGVDGMGYVTGEVSAADAAAIDGMLAAAARSLGAEDPRTEPQRRADLFADLLLGRLGLDESTDDADDDIESADADAAAPTEAGVSGWLEVEEIDPDTGELLGTRRQPVDGDGQPIGEPVDPVTRSPIGRPPKLLRRPGTARIGVVVPLSSLACRPNWPTGPDSSPGRCCGTTSMRRSRPGVVMRCCSPGCSPMMVAGCSIPPN